MIKINLLKGLSGNAKDEVGEAPSGFFGGIFPKKPQNQEEDLDQSAAVLDDQESDNSFNILLKTIIMGSIAIGLFVFQSNNIPRLESELSELSDQLNELVAYNKKAGPAVAEIQRMQEYKQGIEKQISSLNGLSKVRLKYIKVLDLLQSNLPEKMWLTDIDSKGNQLKVEGVSFGETEITKFLEVMGKSIYFSDVSMLSSKDLTKATDESRRLKQFNLNFVLEEIK